MENKEFESRQDFDDNIENVSGGIRFHVTTNDEKIPAKVDAFYLSQKEYDKIKYLKCGNIGNILKNKQTTSFGGTSIILALSNNDKKLLSKSQLTTEKEKPGEIRIDII